MSDSDATSQTAFPVTSVSLEPDVAACWELAGWIGKESSDDHLRSFTSLLIALLHAENPLSKWFLRYARAAGIKVEDINETRQFHPSVLATIKERQDKGEAPSGKPAFSASAENMTKGAQTLLNHTTGGTQLGLRHLLGSYCYSVPEVHQKQMQAWGFDPQREGSAFVRQMRERYQGEAEKWKEIHIHTFKTPPDLNGKDPIMPPRVSSFAADAPDGEDQLNIEDDVYALAALICSTRMAPPLSVGLFGDWGSGKSFFIRQLKRGVSWISQHARESAQLQKDLPFYKNVVQIEFNAWNYSAGNLWAALVQHILENLRLSDDSDDLVAKRVNHLKQQMQLEKEVRDVAVTRQTEAQEQVKGFTKELCKLRDRHDKEIERLKEVLAEDVLKTVQFDSSSVSQLNKMRRELGLPVVAANAGEFLAALEGVNKLLKRTSALVAYVPESQRLRFFWNSALVLLGPACAAVVIGVVTHWFYPYITSISATAGWISTTLALGTRWLRGRMKDLDEPLAQLEQLQAHARQRVEAERQKQQADVASLEQHIALAKDEILAAQAKQQEAMLRLKQMEAELAATTPARVLADFVRERSQSEDYRQHLGLPAVIRRDFERISRMVAQENLDLAKMTSLDQEKTHADERINRIVLYIDDLDRCPEKLVVEVLSAVHLLLAFPLFVVVVAVDARWVSHSLAQHFPGLLITRRQEKVIEPEMTNNEQATPTDYLEKIFQIPFWLKTPNDEAVKRMVHSLVRENLVASTKPDTEHPTPTPTPTPKPEIEPVFRRRQHDPKAASLEIQAEELEYIDRLAPLLGRSPRSVKRFVNVYRLLKAGLPPEDQDTFLEQQHRIGRAPYQDVLFLLALMHGLPTLSEALTEAMLSTRPGNGNQTSPPQPTLGDTLSQLSKQRADLREQVTRLTAWLTTNPTGWENIALVNFKTSAQRVARYSFHPHQL